MPASAQPPKGAPRSARRFWHAVYFAFIDGDIADACLIAIVAIDRRIDTREAPALRPRQMRRRVSAVREVFYRVEVLCAQRFQRHSARFACAAAYASSQARYAILCCAFLLCPARCADKRLDVTRDIGSFPRIIQRRQYLCRHISMSRCSAICADASSMSRWRHACRKAPERKYAFARLLPPVAPRVHFVAVPHAYAYRARVPQALPCRRW